MKKVEFVRLKSTRDGYGMFKGMVYGFDHVEEIIQKRIEEGWEYEGFVPVETRGTGDTETISLIFVKDE